MQNKTTALVINSIKNRQALSFSYRGLRRIVEPHAIGIGHDGRESLSAYLIYGKPIIRGNQWIYCALEDLEEISSEPEEFPGVQPGYVMHDSRFQRFFAAL